MNLSILLLVLLIVSLQAQTSPNVITTPFSLMCSANLLSPRPSRQKKIPSNFLEVIS